MRVCPGVCLVRDVPSEGCLVRVPSEGNHEC